LQILGSTNAHASIARATDNNAEPTFNLAKARGSVGTPTVVVSGDSLGRINFVGHDGTDYESIGAWIKGEVDGTPGANDMPGRIVFSTTAAGASSPTERMRISSDGLVTLSANAGLSVSKTGVTSPAATDGNVFSGTYTPTLTNTTNVASSTAVICQYMRVGNVVTISGQFSVQATTGGIAFVLGMSLPIASNFTLQRQAGGSFSAGSTALTMNVIVADSTNDRLLITGIMTDTASRACAFHATYLIG
jgi:hypothetical protein